MSRRQYEKDNRPGHELPYDDMIRRDAIDAQWSLAYGGPGSRADEINEPPDRLRHAPPESPEERRRRINWNRSCEGLPPLEA